MTRFHLRPYSLRSIESFFETFDFMYCLGQALAKCFYANKQNNLRVNSKALNIPNLCPKTFHKSYHTSLYDMVPDPDSPVPDLDRDPGKKYTP